MELSKINVFAVETNATFRVKTCIKVSKDGGTTYQTIDKALGSNGVTRYWPIYTPGKTTEAETYKEYIYNSTTDAENVNINIDTTNDCVSTYQAYWPGAGYYRGGLRIKVDESKLDADKIKGATSLKFKTTTRIIWDQYEDTTWTAVDYRTVLNGKNNTNDYNKVIGFCAQQTGCPINSSMYGTMEGGSTKQISKMIYGNASDLEENYVTVSLHTGALTTSSYGITSNYAVKDSLSGNIITINRCDGGGNNCGAPGINRASSDAFIELNYQSSVKINAYAVTTNKVFLNDGNQISNAPKIIKPGGSLKLTRPTFDGYIFRGWYSASSNSKDGCKSYASQLATSADYSVNSVSESGTVCAVYEPTFEAQAYVAKTKNYGDSSGDGNDQTGWISGSSNNKSASIELSCSDEGCNAYFWIKLRTQAGTGKTKYRTGTKIDDGDISWSGYTTSKELSSDQYADNVYIIGAKNAGQAQKLSPGKSYCYYLEFRPDNSVDSYKQVSACAKVKSASFEGKSNVSGDANSKMEYRKSDKSITVTIKDCVNGCLVTFTHAMKRNGDTGSSTFNVSRTSNLTTGDRAIANNSDVKHGTFNESEKNVSQSAQLKLYPGMVVCEQLRFDSNNTANKTDIITEVCVSALGNAQPDDPPEPDDPSSDNNGDSESSAFIKMEVKNTSVSKYNTFRTLVYAKPGDKLVYRATYNPILQYTYNLKPQKMRIEERDGETVGSIYPTSGTNSTSTLGTMFNNYKSSKLKNWNNAFSVQRVKDNKFSDSSVILIKNHIATPGDTTRKSEQNDYTVLGSDAGMSTDERAITNLNATVLTTPGQVVFTNNDGNLGTVKTKDKSSTAYARVPYNYTTSSEITNPEDASIPAGEESTVYFDIDIIKKTNTETSPDEPYATKVPNPVIKLIVYYPSAPDQRAGNSGWSNPNGRDADLCSYYGLPNNQTQCGFKDAWDSKNDLEREHNELKANFYAQDLKAGSTICVAVANYPSTSGADTNLDKEGDKKWNISASKCYPISKKPSIQIWGGNIYSSDKITTSTSVKNNLAGLTNYSIHTGNDNNYVFGSWGELGVISGGTVKGLTSGAALGYSELIGDNLWPSYHPDDGPGNNAVVASHTGVGGNIEFKTSMCHRSTLTFANADCSGGAVGALGASTASSSANKDKESIKNKFVVDSKPNYYDETLTILNDDRYKIEDTNKYYYYSADDLTVSNEANGGFVTFGTIQVVHSDKTITISHDLIYDVATGYTKLEDMPKLVIYAKNIVIDCGVKRIDALLVADENVKTCNSDNINDIRNSNQLVINGAVIANSLTANRTYGSATGANSMIPSEIINFDPTLYLWGGSRADDETKELSLDITMLQEVSQRF
ncbi:hypothetical protein IKF67_02540 [Candidatus Saccharibacteria bacterium]|nr:hypothetical protein [Candidatus Saccharibacteria bacterium]